MSFLYLTGSKMNAFGRGTVLVSPAEASVALKTNLYDNDPSSPMIAGSITTDPYVEVYVNALTNPGFETSTLSGWTSGTAGTGTSAETSTAGEFRSGSKALELTGTDTSNYGSRYQTITVAAGEYRKATFYGRAIGAGVGKLFLKNLKTGNYYNGGGGGAWGSTRASAVSASATTAFAVPGVATTVTYQVEDFDTCRADTVSLRWELACESGDYCFDDCADFPGVNFCAVFGHNLGNMITPTVRSYEEDGVTHSDHVTMALKRPACFGTFAMAYAYWWRLFMIGTPHEAPYLGEAVFGQYQTCATSPKWGLPKTRAFPGGRSKAGSIGRPVAYNFATDPPQDIEVEFSARTAAASREIAESIWLRSGQGLYPVILVPIDTETDVYFGRLFEPVTVERPFQGVYETTLKLAGDPFPTVGL